MRVQLPPTHLSWGRSLLAVHSHSRAAVSVVLRPRAALCLSSRSTQRSCPALAASSSAVLPSASLLSGLAPASSRSSTTPRAPLAQARCSAVRPASGGRSHLHHHEGESIMPPAG
jgi:hypothetical protein